MCFFRLFFFVSFLKWHISIHSNVHKHTHIRVTELSLLHRRMKVPKWSVLLIHSENARGEQYTVLPLLRTVEYSFAVVSWCTNSIQNLDLDLFSSSLAIDFDANEL